jgi:hypothetical protein
LSALDALRLVPFFAGDSRGKPRRVKPHDSPEKVSNHPQEALGWSVVVAKLLRRKLRWRSPLRHSPIHRTTTDAELRRVSLAVLYIPALKDGVFLAI